MKKPSPEAVVDLAKMSVPERALALVLALQASGPLRALFEGGYVQFMATARRPCRNYGFRQADLEAAWFLVEYCVRSGCLPGSLLQRADDAWLAGAPKELVRPGFRLSVH